MKNERGNFEMALILAVLFATLAFVSIGCASATIYVPENFTTIQQAVNNATANDIIIVRDGTYTENVDVNVNHLTIKSENGSASTIVQAANSDDHVFEVTVDWVNISGFTIIGANRSGIVGIYLNRIEYCKIINNNVSDNDQAICLYWSDNNIITNNMVDSNNGSGIEVVYSSDNKIMYNIVNSNTNYGIHLHSPSKSGICHGTWPFNFETNSEDSDPGTDFRWKQVTSEERYLVPGHGAVFANLGSSVNYDSIDCPYAQHTLYSTDIIDGSIYNNQIPDGTVLLCRTGEGNYVKMRIDTYGYTLYFTFEFLCQVSNNTLANNTILNNDYGIHLYSSSNNTIYNNYFNNTNNAYDNGNNQWNITKTLGTNIIGGSYLGGNYWSDYAGEDLDGDGLGDTLIPYNSSDNIQNGGDYLPLTMPVSTPTPTPEATTVSITPSTKTISPGAFTVNVTIEPEVPIAGVQFDLSFDPSLLRANNVTEGNLLKQSGANTFFYSGTIDNAAGTITGVASAITTPGETVSTPGVFATIQMTAKSAAGTSTLDLSNVIVGDINGNPMAIAVNDGSVTISTAPWDVNGDGFANVLDMILVGQHFGETGAPGWIPEDVNRDGVINVRDMLP